MSKTLCLSPEREDICSPPGKRPKLETPEQGKCLIYIVEKKISAGHLFHLKGVAAKKGFSITNSISDDVTHIVTSLTSYERLTSVLSSGAKSVAAEIVSLDWLTSSFIEGKPLQVTDRYRLQKTLGPTTSAMHTVSSSAKEKPYTIPEYECQRATLLKHHNHIFTEALELLERYYQHLDHKEGDTRALAYRQASCALKVLPKKIEDISEIAHLPRIGKHSGQVIEDILASDSSQEVDKCRKSEWFQCMELFAGVYGCGSATANKWYQKGLRSLQDVQDSKEIQLTETQKLGLTYYEHLSAPVTREETEVVVSYIQRQLEVCLPCTSVEAVGGYRRGKPHGHDVDLLLTNPDGTVADTLLNTLLIQLHKQGVVIHCDVTSGHNNTHVSSTHYLIPPTQGKNRRVKFDNLDKAFCILSLPQPLNTATSAATNRDGIMNTPNMIKRVDFIVCPPEQYPFALVSWTGSKQFNRSLRRYSAKELNMTVTAHGIYDIAQSKTLVATTERGVFDLLKLEYREPWERNC